MQYVIIISLIQSLLISTFLLVITTNYNYNYGSIENFAIFFLSLVVSLVLNYVLFYFLKNKYSKAEKNPIVKLPLNQVVEMKKREIRGFVNNIFNSDDFYIAVSQALPKGKSDKDLGMDYIPFMLSSLRIKRNLFRRTSNIFLIVTIGLAILFSSILFYYGNILIREDSVGLYNSFETIKEDTPKLLTDIKRFKLSFQNEIEDDNLLRSIRDSIAVANKIDNSLNNAPLIIRDPQKLEISSLFDVELYQMRLDSISNYYKNLPSQHPLKIQSNVSNKIIYNISKIKEQSRRIIGEYRLTLNDYENDLDKINKEFASIETRIEELKNEKSYSDFLKRLSIGLITTTFFLTILRFSANLYKRNYLEMIKTEEDSLKLRKLYVGFKNINGDEESKNIVIKALLDFDSNLRDSSESKNEESKLDVNNALKQLIELIGKKI